MDSRLQRLLELAFERVPALEANTRIDAIRQTFASPKTASYELLIPPEASFQTIRTIARKRHHPVGSELVMDRILPFVARFNASGENAGKLAECLGESIELSVAGQNLLTSSHIEFLDGLQVIPTQAGRGIVGKMTWHF